MFKFRFEIFGSDLYYIYRLVLKEFVLNKKNLFDIYMFIDIIFNLLILNN